MQLVEVTTKSLARDFLHVNVLLNRSNPNYIQPLNKDVEDVFDRKKNKAFRFGDAKRWILKKDGVLIGRIAAFINKRYKNKGDDVKVGGIGFFDCIDDIQAAEILFEQAKSWLLQQQVEAMDGPINFGERDRWWGLVVEGFQPPLYCMNYNPPYYQKLFETYGFKRFFGQVCYATDPQKRISEKLFARHALCAADPAFRSVRMDKKHLEHFAKDFAEVYNAAWSGHGGIKQVRKEQVLQMFRQMKAVMDERVIWFIYHAKRPVGIFVNLPDLNQWFRHLHGKFDLLNKLKFLWIKKTRLCTKFVGLVFGIVPEYQGKGVDAFMMVEAHNDILKTHYTDYEMQWIGDFNPKMLNLAENLGDVYRSRLLVTYRYLFDRDKEFKPHPIL